MNKPMCHRSNYYGFFILSQVFFLLSALIAFIELGENGYPALLMSFFLSILLPVIIQMSLGNWMPNTGMVLLIASISWFLGMCLLLWGWLPSLIQLDALHGFDPARYYFRSMQLIDSGFNMSGVDGGLADPGILYFYAVVMAILGKNIFAPYFANYIIFFTFLICLLRSLRWQIPDGRKLWFFAVLMLIPEFVWFSVLPGKDLLTALLSGFILIWYVSKIRNQNGKKTPFLSILAILSFITIAIVRPTYLLILIVSLGCIFLLHARFRVLLKIMPYVMFVMLTVVYVVPVASRHMEAVLGNTDLISRATSYVASDQRARILDKHAEGFSANSIALRLIPSTASEYIYLAPLRDVAYIVAPLNILWTGLNLNGEPYIVAQRISQFVTTLIILFGIVYFIIKRSVFYATCSMFKSYLIFFVISLTVISNVVIILQPRYRVFSILFYFVFLSGFFVVLSRKRSRFSCKIN